MSSVPLIAALPRIRGERAAAVQALRRAALPAAAVGAVLGLAIALGGGPLQTLTDALARAIRADARWMAAALAFEGLSFAGYAVLLSHVAGRAGPRMELRTSAQVALAGAAATRVLPTAGMGGAALTLWTLQRTGHPGRAGTRTLLTFLVLLYAVFLAAIVLAGVLVAVRGDGPVALGAAPAALAATVIAVGAGVGRRVPPDPADASRSEGLRAGWRSATALLPEAVRDAGAHLRRPDARLLGAPAWWAFDVAVLWAAFQALGTPPGLPVLLLAYFVGQVANTIPLPGAVSGGTVGMLLALGTPADLALAAVLAYRAIAIWVPGTAGTAALAALTGTVARQRDGEPAAAPLSASGSAWSPSRSCAS